MKTLRQLSPTDVLFLAAETECVYNHVGGLVLLAKNKGKAISYRQFRRYMQNRLEQVPQMSWKLQDVPLGLDLPYWVEDENFNYDRHIRRIAVPSPGDEKALVELAAYLFSRPLDHRRPLWEIWLIEGLKGGNVAVLHKLHHCLMDGQGAARLAEAMFDNSPNPKSVVLDESIASAPPVRAPQAWELRARTALKYARLPGDTTATAAELLRAKISGMLRRPKKKAASAPPVAMAAFNAELGRDRGFVYGSLPMADLKRVAAAHKVSINDVVMALIGGSLRRYLRERKSLPKESLRAMMAVSLRSSEDETMSNQVTNATVTMATNSRSPGARLKAIHRETQQAKARVKSGSKGAMEIFEMMPPALIATINALVDAQQTVQMMGANLVVSNLRGSEKPQYLAGAKVKATYPMSVLSNGITLNVTCISYNGGMNFGVILDPDLFPDPWSLIEGLRLELDEFLADL